MDNCETINKNSKIPEIEIKRNTVYISGLAITSLRYQVSNREAAACASAYLGDLIRAGVLPPDATYLAVDPAKVQRARDSLIAEATCSGLEQLEEDKPNCLLFDSRIDATRVLHYDEETGKFYTMVELEKEDHYTVTDGDGTYLTHLTKPGKSVFDPEDEKIPEGTDALELEEVVEGEASDRDDET